MFGIVHHLGEINMYFICNNEIAIQKISTRHIFVSIIFNKKQHTANFKTFKETIDFLYENHIDKLSLETMLQLTKLHNELLNGGVC